MRLLEWIIFLLVFCSTNCQYRYSKVIKEDSENVFSSSNDTFTPIALNEEKHDTESEKNKIKLIMSAMLNSPENSASELSTERPVYWEMIADFPTFECKGGCDWLKGGECVAGTCMCRPPLINRDNKCVDVNADFPTFECKGGCDWLKGGECVAGTCMCRPPLINRDNKCVDVNAEFGNFQCSGGCDWLKGGECFLGTCGCTPVTIRVNNECLNLAFIGGSCSSNEQCLTKDSVCVIDDSGSGKCRCKSEMKESGTLCIWKFRSRSYPWYVYIGIFGGNAVLLSIVGLILFIARKKKSTSIDQNPLMA